LFKVLDEHYKEYQPVWPSPHVQSFEDNFAPPSLR